MDLGNYFNFLSTASAIIAALIAYLAIYRNSMPQLVVYYQPSKHEQSLIDLVIENIGTGQATAIKFSKEIPINWFGIEEPLEEGGYIPKFGIPSLSPRQRLVFMGGQFAGLSRGLEKSGGKIKIYYSFNPPLWRRKSATDTCFLSIEHLRGMASQKSMERAVVDAIDGRNQTTIKDIRDALNAIEKHLASFSTSRKIL